MDSNTIPLKKEKLIEFLKSFPEDDLEEIFLSLLVGSDDSPLSEEEREAIRVALQEYESGETIKWEDIK